MMRNPTKSLFWKSAFVIFLSLGANPLWAADKEEYEVPSRIVGVEKFIEDWEKKKKAVRFIEQHFEAIRGIIKCRTCNELEHGTGEPIWDYYHSCQKKEESERKDKGESGERSENSGYSGATIIEFRGDGVSPVQIIKTFKETDKGLKEFVYSLMAFRIHQDHGLGNELKMVEIYDAVMCPDALSFVMEKALGGDIHSFMKTNDRYGVIRACARYLGTFHVRQLEHQAETEEVQGTKYLAHAASFFHKLSENPRQSLTDQKGVKLFRLDIGKQRKDVEVLKSDNIIDSLDSNREICIFFIKRTQDLFEKCSGYVYRALKPSGAQTERPYWTTITHGDAHRRNFFYNNLDMGGEAKDSLKRVTMIDYSSIMETYGNIGDPAQDIGRFLGSLWDWASEESLEEEAMYKIIYELQEIFLHAYINTVTGKEEKKEERKEEICQEDQCQPPLGEDFYNIFIENSNFYKLRYYRAIFNSDEKRKTNESKIRLLKFWVEEMKQKEKKASESDFATKLLKPKEYIRKRQPRDWNPIAKTEDVIRNLPEKLAVFIEDISEDSPSYLTKLWRQLNDTGKATVTSNVSIAGMGGIGKTSLALEYAHEALEKGAYNLIWWLHSEQPELFLKQGYEDILVKTSGSAEVPENSGKEKEEENPIKKLKILIEHYFTNCRAPEQWLLIYDNAKNSGSLGGLIPQHKNIHVLITSRNQEWGNAFNLQAFHPEDSVRYLLAETGLNSSIDKDKESLARKVAEKLGHLPVALTLAANYVKLIGGEAVDASLFEEFLESFEKDPSSSINCLKDQEPYELLVGISYDMLEEELGKDSAVSQYAKDMMVWCAYLNPDLIPESIFLGTGDDQGKTAEALNKLYGLSLIKKSGDNSFSVHRLVQRVILKKQATNDPLLAISKRMETLFHQHVADDGKFAKILTFLPHVISLLEHYAQQEVKREEKEKQEEEQKKRKRKRESAKRKQEMQQTQKSSLLWIGRILHTWYDSKDTLWKHESQNTTFTEMNSLFDEILEKRKNLPELLNKKDSEDEAQDPIFDNGMHHRIYCALGLIYAYGDFGFQKNYKLSCEYLTKSYEIDNWSAPYYLGRFYEKGWVKGNIPNDKEAMKWYKKAADFKNHNAMVYIGKLCEKYALQNKKDMEFYKDKAKLENHIDKIDEKPSLQNKKDTGEWQKQKKKRNKSAKILWYEEAMEWYQKAAALENHHAMTNIGKLYQKGWVEGDKRPYEAAMWWYQKAAALRNHEAMTNIGWLYEKGFIKGDKPPYEAAMWWYQKAQKLGNHHAMFNLGKLYEREKKYEDARKYYEKAEKLGNPDAQAALKGLPHRKDGKLTNPAVVY